ncbi:unnamed protein product [Cladocopium goreaui]|uniref:C2H2-type domain-containing protein n=1 Tax=Cladocopium goreaui TaxID=2562237 RepID=A0A9P1D568_9DINO|nr:unnamed protein product [Cladocopium goreaui]
MMPMMMPYPQQYPQQQVMTAPFVPPPPDKGGGKGSTVPQPMTLPSPPPTALTEPPGHWAPTLQMMPVPALPTGAGVPPETAEEVKKEGKAQANLNRLLKQMKKGKYHTISGLPFTGNKFFFEFGLQVSADVSHDGILRTLPLDMDPMLFLKVCDFNGPGTTPLPVLMSVDDDADPPAGDPQRLADPTQGRAACLVSHPRVEIFCILLDLLRLVRNLDFGTLSFVKSWSAVLFKHVNFRYIFMKVLVFESNFVADLQRCLTTSMRVLEDEETTTSIMPITAPEDILEDPVAIDRFPAEQEDLVTSWRSAASISTAIITEDGETKVKFVTWFLNGDRWPRCDAYRVVALPADLERWEALFRQRWHDRVDPAAQLHVSLVYPPVTPDNHGGHLILHQGRSGYSIVLQTRPRPHPRPTETAVNRSNRAPVLLQLSNLLQREVLSQEESADEPSLTASTTVAIRLRSGCDSILVPEYIECSAPGDSNDIEAELTHWGIACKAVRFGPRHEALCLPVQWIASANQFHYMFCHDDPKDDEGTFLHTSEVALDDLGLMQLLYKLGYCRAAILDTEEPMPQFFRIIFRDVVQQHAVKPEKHKAPSPWPAPLCCNRENRPFFTPKGHIEGKDDFLLRFGITMTDIHAFFASGTDVLCRDPAGLDLPESTMQAMHMSETTNLASFDRLIIYTDGSSLPLHRHRPAAWNEEKGLGDTWAFVVLGERSLQQPPVIEIIGWLTHPVRYDPSCPTFLGLRQIARRHRQELLRACFQSWATTSDYDIEGFWTYRRWLLCANVKLMARFHTSAAHLKKKLRDRKTAYLKQVFADLPPDAPASSILHALKKVVGSTNLKQIKQQTLPYVKDSSGQHCTSPSQALDTWIQFFQNMEGGRRVNRQEQRQLWIKNLQAFQATSLDLMITDVPSLVELEAAFRHVKPNKATGPDLIDANVCASSPAIVARKTYSQLLKLYTHGQESLLHKGGRLQPIWKQKGPRDACSAYRSVLISSHIGKSLHRCLRLHSADVFEHYLQLQQTGGMRGISVTMGVHQARSYLRTRLRQRKCVGLLFLDLTEAFYRIVRQLALGGPPDDAAIVAVGDRLQLGPDLLHALHQHLEDQSAVERADIVFSFLWARLLHRLEQMMSDNGILDSFPAEDGLRLPATDVSECGTQSFLGPTWMDDTCIAFATDSAVTLEQAAGRVGGSLLGLCAEFAMSPNLAKGKTELMMVFQGKGATQAKLKYFGPSSPQTFPIILEDGIQHLSVVSSYTHLGSTIHHRGDLRREVRRRLGLAHAAFNRHRKLLFQNRGLDLCRRRELFRTLILSKLLYGAESWTLRDGKDKHYLHSALMRLYNRLLPVQQHPPRSDAAILADTGLPDPAVLLRVCRLRHLGQLYGNGHRTSWGLFNDDLEWQELIWCDLKWMWNQLKHSSQLPDPLQGFQQWEYLMRHHPGFWKRLIRRAGDHDSGQRRNLHIVTEFHGEFLKILQDHGRLCQTMPHHEALSGDQIHACMMCEKRFLSKGGCGAHLFRAHGHVNSVRHLFSTSQCGACMKEYHTFAKLKTHLLQVTACRQILQAQRLRWQPMPGAGSQINATMEAAHDGLLPPLKVQGPLLERPHGRADEDFDQDFLEKIFIDIVDAENIAECERLIRTAARETVLSWSTFQATLERFLELFTDADAAGLRVPGDELRHLLVTLRSPHAWTFLTSDGRAKTSPWHLEIAALEQHCLREIEGGIAAVEHPAESPHPEEASIWRTPIMQLLLSLPECESITLAQGLWGAQSAKPTTLGVLNAPQLKQELHRGRITTEVPKSTSIGKDASGQWATARLKEYPPGLCLALARGFLRAISDVPINPEFQVSRHYSDIFGPLVCSAFGQTYGPDYAG